MKKSTKRSVTIKWVDERVSSKGDEDDYSYFGKVGDNFDICLNIWKGKGTKVEIGGEMQAEFGHNRSLSLESGKVDVVVQSMETLEKMAAVFGGKITWSNRKGEKK